VVAVQTVLERALPLEQAWIALSVIEERGGQPARALPILDQAARRLGDRVGFCLARAGYWKRHPGDDARKELAALRDKAQAYKAEDRHRLLEGWPPPMRESATTAPRRNSGPS